MKKVEVKDWCTIYKFSKNGYGDVSVGEKEEVKCLFLYGMSQSEAAYTDMTQTDAHAYLDIDNEFVRRLMTKDFKTEAYYFVINRYGQEEWFKIDKLKIGRTVLTDNKDNNVHVFLSKCAKLI